MNLSGIFYGTFAILRRRVGLFLLIALIPVATAIGGMVILGLLAGALLVPAGQNPSLLPAMLIIGGALILVFFLAVWLVQVKAYGMMSTGFYEVAQGHEPTVRSLWSQTRGLLPRIAVYLVLILALTLVLVAVIVLLVFVIVGAANNHNGGAVFGGVMGALALLAVFTAGEFFLSIKLLYIVQSVAIEELDSIAAIKRSWHLTDGAFWRTTGYALVASVIVALISRVVSLISSAAQIPLRATPYESGSSEQIAMRLTVGIWVAILVVALQFVVQLFTQPFLIGYVTCMYIDQVGRTEMPALAYAPPVPGGYMTPPAYYPQQYPPPNPYAAEPWNAPQPDPGNSAPGEMLPPQAPPPPDQQPPAAPSPWAPPPPN